MIDPLSIVLEIPDIVDSFVKTCQFIQAYQGIEDKHKTVISDAIHYSRKLNYYAHFVDCSPLQAVDSSCNVEDEANACTALTARGDPEAIDEDSRTMLCRLFKESTLALATARDVIDDWTVRLGVETDSEGRSRLLFARIALAISDRLVRKKHSSNRGKRMAVFADFRGKLHFLILGSQQIEDAMGRLKHSLRELRDILMVSPSLHRRLSSANMNVFECKDEPTDDVLFVSMAREREKKSCTMEIITPEMVSNLSPLDDRKSQSFMMIKSEDSPFYGCLVDRRNVLHLLHSQKGELALKDTERIARLFAEERDEFGHYISASVGILPCCGFARPVPEYHDLVFRLPQGTRRPQTLRSLLLHGCPQHPLNSRLEFAIKLATAVLIVHSLNLVHKDLRPDSIIVVDPIDQIRDAPGHPKSLGEPYLMAFNESRSLDSATVPLSDVQYRERRWASLYQHPRHLTSPTHLTFEIRDDIYSLGVCLLEIAIWKSLFIWDDTDKIYVNDTTVCDLSEERYDKMLEEMGEDPNCSQAWLRQIDLEQLARKKVPVTMGEAFKDVVIECLTFGLEKQSISEARKGGQIRIAHMKNQSITFIRNVLSKLRGLKLM